MLYLGGNRLQEIPEEVGGMSSLTSLVLCDNKLHSLPPSLVTLRRLQSLSLHNNQLSTLPPAMVKLNLSELSLRNNPLVVRFVQEMMYEPPSLLELSGRVVKAKNIPYSRQDLPPNLMEYLGSAHRCVNPKCKGKYTFYYIVLFIYSPTISSIYKFGRYDPLIVQVYIYIYIYIYI